MLALREFVPSVGRSERSPEDSGTASADRGTCVYVSAVRRRRATGPVAVVVACAVALVTTGTARASCGAYVLVNGRPTGKIVHLGAADGGARPTLPVRVPCDGPHCQRAPTTVPTAQPLATPVQETGNSGSWLATWDEAQHSGQWLLDGCPAAAAVFLAGIFRPPRQR